MATGMTGPNMPPPAMRYPPGMGSSGMTTTHGMGPSGMSMKGGNKMTYGGSRMATTTDAMATTTHAMKGGKRTKKAKKGGLSFFGVKLFGGASKMPAVGSKASVYHGKAKHTSGGLTRKDLMKTKHGRIVSRKKHALGKKALKNLVKAGYKAKKGTFKLFRK